MHTDRHDRSISCRVVLATAAPDRRRRSRGRDHGRLSGWAGLGWHELQHYDRSQVTYLALLLAVLAAWSGWRRPFVVGSVVLTATLVVLWSVDAWTSAGDGANLWLVGAMMLALPTAAGAFSVSWLVSVIRTAQLRRSAER